MSNSVLKAVGALAALVPTLALAQQRPAQQPAQRPPAQQPRPAAQPAQRPAAQPAQRPAPARRMGPHREGGFELSIGGGLLAIDKQLLPVSNPSTSDKVAPAVFGGLTYHLTSRIGITGGAAFGKRLGVTRIQPQAGITWTPDINRPTAPFISVGGGLTRSSDGTRISSQYGAFGGLGVRHMIGENLAVRLEGRVQYENYSEASVPNAVFNGAASLGISYFTGGGPPRDTDGDGVPDRRDRCANTPRGAIVDANGCPRDSDRDGVADGLDRCANTPANTPVDANGCPRDSDSDGVADNLDRCPNTPANARPVDANGCPRDSDSDGVADYLDRCANTTAGTPVDANGCPRDSDSDGVADNLDRCPNTPAGTPVDANGCPRDSDSDGVADNLDRCPNTPAGTQVGPDGCPVARDSDHDQVPDDRDRCPNTPAGRMVDANGCPLAELPAATQSMVLRNVTFAAGTARLTPASQTVLDGIATSIQAVVRQSANARFEVGGYTDNRGVAATNRRISQARAQAVVTYLTGKGVPASALTAVGYGPDNPKAPNTTAAGRAQNRRVEIKRLQ